MKKIACILLFIIFIFVFENYRRDFINADDNKNQPSPSDKIVITDNTKINHRYPDFYRGIYLTIETGRNFNRLKQFVEQAKRSYINTFVIDVQTSKLKKCMVPAEHVTYLLQNGIHPVARVVMFPDGLKNYPLPQGMLDERLAVAEESAQNGFKEIQFDYIRFNDSERNRHLGINERYAFINGILTKARERLQKYNVRIAADVFGRIPLNKNDLIGQHMESLDQVVDIICPMAYPSHYTWSKKMQNDPYYTVFITSKSADDRTKQANIVTYIQAFKMRLGPNAYDAYIEAQLKAIHDSGIKGFIMWNARQDYAVPFAVARNYYSGKISKAKSDVKVIDD